MRVALAIVLACGCAEAAPPHDAATAHAPIAPVAHDAAIARDSAHEASACARCHPAQAAAWRGSLHAISASDPIYRAEHEPRADPWCTGCHAPAGEERGIDCAVCHGEPIAAAQVSGRARHPSRVDEAMGDERACARCHDFDFPRGPRRPMQDTLDEWRSSPASRERTCIDCHDPHAAPGRRDEAQLARALDVRATAVRSGAGARVTLTLRSRAGHAVPTGDLFRRLVVTATSGGISRSRVLTRRFDLRDGHRVEASDTRVPPVGVRTVVLDLPRAGERVRWSIELHALAEARARARGLSESAWRSRVADGAVSVRDAP